MILKCTSFEGMQREIVGRDMSIVVFGAGVIGTVTVPEILRRYDLLGRVAFYVDNGPNIQGRRITLQDRSVDVKPAKALNGAKDNTVLIIAVSRYAEIVSQL